MNNQEAFDIVAAHLLKQTAKSLLQAPHHPITACAYRSPNGMKCAVGALIPDELYDPKMERFCSISVLETFPALAVYLKGVDGDLIYELQVLHDDHDPKNWPIRLNEIANKYELDHYPR